MKTILRAVSIFLFGTAFIGLWVGGDPSRICAMMGVAIYLKLWE